MSEQPPKSKFKVLEPVERLIPDGLIYKKWQGRIYPPFIDPKWVEWLMNSWDTEANDVVICTHQKVGTHLTKKFVVEILRKLIDYPSDNPMSTGDIGHSTVPWPEVMVSQHGVEDFEAFRNKTVGLPRVWYTHCEDDDLPIRNIHPETRFIMVFRDPRGAAVSQYFFYKSHPLLQMPQDITIDEFVKMFLDGNLYFGDYHKHVLKWSQRCNGRISANRLLMLRYEDLVERKYLVTKLLSEFLVPDKKLTPDQMGMIVSSTEFDTMKKGIIENPGSFHFNPNTFFRSGTINDWETKLSPESIEAINAKSMEIWGDDRNVVIPVQ
ncbi:MAG: sulfotransferase domain-containing protein [Bacteroidia bacterium]